METIHINKQEEIEVAINTFKQDTMFRRAVCIVANDKLFLAVAEEFRKIHGSLNEPSMNMILQQREFKWACNQGIVHFMTQERAQQVAPNFNTAIIEKTIEKIRENHKRLEEYLMRDYAPPVTFNGIYPLIQKEE